LFSCIFYFNFPFPIDPSELENPFDVYDYDDSDDLEGDFE